MNGFRTIQAQAVLFTSEAQFRSNRFLAYFLSEWGHLFNGEPTSFEPPSKLLLFEGLPRVMLKSEDGSVRLQASGERLDFFRNVQDDSSIDIRSHFEQAVDIFNGYLEKLETTSGRVAVIVLRGFEDDNPAKTISHHFCREKWLEGPINRPREFEVHSLKHYRMHESLEVNSWFRCRSGKMVREAESERVERRAVLVEQDLNTPGDLEEPRTFSKDDIRNFFSLAPRELDVILGLYFPANEGS